GRTWEPGSRDTNDHECERMPAGMTIPDSILFLIQLSSVTPLPHRDAYSKRSTSLSGAGGYGSSFTPNSPLTGGGEATWPAQRDRALDALRSRPDFQFLMMDLAMPAEPFARGD